MHSSNRHNRDGKAFHKRNFSRSYNNKIPGTTHAEQLYETDVGISEYISKLKGFSGVIKARFSDFQVNEINLDGEVAVLTNTQIPTIFKRKTDECKEVPQTSPSEGIPQETWNQIVEMMESAENKVVELDVTSVSKEKRGDVHATVKRIFKQNMVASTVTKDEKKFIQFKKYAKGERSDDRMSWPESVGNYVHFLVYKENMDTLEATLKISDCLRMKASAFAYAGVKDRRAKTTQWFSVRKVEPWKLLRRTKHIRYLHIGNITFKKQPLKLGQLKGNKFRIALRNIVAADDLVNEAMDSLKENGFINYYGLQRFGNDKEVPTYEIGLQLLLGNFKEACDLILKCKKNDIPGTDTTKAKKIYNETRDAEAASKCFEENGNRCVESKLIMGLAKSNPNDYVNALENVPRNMRLLYIHSIQALVWNKIVSRRIKEFGLKPIVGDLVIVKEAESLEEMEIVPGEDESKVKDENIVTATEDKESENEDESDDETTNDDTDDKCAKMQKPQVKVLNEEDLESHSIYDIVLPLPGYDIVYPNNIVKDWYKEVLESYGLSLEMAKQSVKTYNLAGNYRTIVQEVNELGWKFIHYNDPNDNLIRSDFEELLGRKEPEDVVDGKYKALVMAFTVKPSSYATMVIREILKTDTSSSSQAKLNNYHEPKMTETKGAQSESLLSNPEKFEEFKKCIFGVADGETSKRRCEEENIDMQVKKLKENDDSEDIEKTGLTLEPSPV